MKKITVYFLVSVFLFVSMLSAEDNSKQKWQSLFNGKNLDGWIPVLEYELKTVESKKTESKKIDTEKNNVTKNRNEKNNIKKKPNVRVENGVIVINSIAGMEGMKYVRKFPQCDYEICFEAKRIEGSDFFAAITFPVGKDFCTFVNGGWGGSTIGLSCIDGIDASENESFDMYTFNDNEWYKFRIIVTKSKIEIWITGKDGEKKSEEKQVVNLEYKNRKISLREETVSYKPLGFAAWYSTGNLKNIKFRLR
ncbi:MAG: DUF1080 domain-containing protein [Planctomycetaceae bacterium]|nr:DUF1080 domain-containing protein [Planctomycetaceae bacterium]